MAAFNWAAIREQVRAEVAAELPNIGVASYPLTDEHTTKNTTSNVREWLSFGEVRIERERSTSGDAGAGLMEERIELDGGLIVLKGSKPNRDHQAAAKGAEDRAVVIINAIVTALEGSAELSGNVQDVFISRLVGEFGVDASGYAAVVGFTLTMIRWVT